MSVLTMGNIHKVSIRSVSLLSLLVLLGGGCRSGEKQEELSITARMRTTVNPEAARYLVIADENLSQGAYNAALNNADSAKYLEPELADVPFLRGLIYAETRRYQEALGAYERVLELDPYYQGAWMNIGSLALRQGKFSDALAAYQAEMKTYPAAAVMLQIGRTYAELEQLDSARWAFEEAIALDDTYATAFFHLSEFHKENGELDLALSYSRKGVALRPDNLNYCYLIGSLLVLTGKPEEAIKYLEPVVEGRPWHYWSHYNMGQVLVRLGRADEAQEYFDKAEQLKEMTSVVQDWQDLVEANPDQLMLWVNYGTSLYKMQRYDEAITAYKMALSLAPFHLDLHTNLANLYVLSGDTLSAVTHLRAILERDPTFTDAWLNLGVIYGNLGKLDAAQQAWGKVLVYSPDDSMAKAYLEQLDTMR